MDYILETRDLYYSYGDKPVLKGLNLVIRRHNMVGILGPNGSGKTTLLRNISAALKPQSGQVILDQRDIFSLRRRELARKVAYVPQNTAVDFEFTAFDIVMMGRIPYMKRFQAQRPEDVAAAQWAMEMTGTWALKDRCVNELSGGEAQRVMIARALAQQPEILMLDEPTSHLDIQFQMDILELLRRLVDCEGLTVISILHDINLAMQFCDNVLFLQSGSIIADGRPQDVITEQLIREVYHVNVKIWRDEASGAVCVAPVRKASLGPSAAEYLTCTG